MAPSEDAGAAGEKHQQPGGQQQPAVIAAQAFPCLPRLRVMEPGRRLEVRCGARPPERRAERHLGALLYITLVHRLGALGRVVDDVAGALAKHGGERL
ncbi:hypothetical protein G6F23_014220 [Rhizopus arrhizus]|nr:hypothetical protein G6F23_014220 [Rhizopus arrhizus]